MTDGITGDHRCSGDLAAHPTADGDSVAAANVEGLDLNPFPGSTDVRGVTIAGE